MAQMDFAAAIAETIRNRLNEFTDTARQYDLITEFEPERITMTLRGIYKGVQIQIIEFPL